MIKSETRRRPSRAKNKESIHQIGMSKTVTAKREIEVARMLAGLEKIKVTMRRCLSCDRDFLSHGINSKLCDSCKTRHID